MKVLAVCGSFRDESNTNKLVKRIAEFSECDFELIYLGKLDIKPCTGCANCMMNEGRCVIDDDMQDLYEKLMDADALIVGSPTYYMDVSAAVKSLIDRSLALNYRGVGPEYAPGLPVMGHCALAGKKGIALTTVAGDGHKRALETLKLWMVDSHRLDLIETLAEVVGMDDVDDMPEVLKRAEAAGKKLGKVLKEACN
jgi:multimeric flavodoxin WrbA